MKHAKRLDLVPPYLFAEIDKKRNEAIAKGIDVINLGIGDPDLPTPSGIIDAMKKALDDPKNHNYPPYEGTDKYKEASAKFYEKRFGIKLDYKTEILAIIGSKEGLAHLPFAFVDEGDYTLVPDPAYPVYKVATQFAGGIPYTMPLLEENGFLPDLTKIPTEIAKKSKIMFLNYPNNPTGAMATKEFYEEAVQFAKKYDILICSDLAYSEQYYDDYKPLSILEIEGSKDVCIELNSLSKSFNMTGWRVGFAGGNAEAISALGKLKNNVDSGVFKAIQCAGIEALENFEKYTKQVTKVYQPRRDVVIEGLNSLGWNIKPAKATFYIWFPVPKGYNSTEFSALMLDKAGIVLPAGVGYGEYGEGYVRIALTASEDRLKEAIQRMRDNNIRFA